MQPATSGRVILLDGRQLCPGATPSVVRAGSTPHRSSVSPRTTPRAAATTIIEGINRSSVSWEIRMSFSSSRAQHGGPRAGLLGGLGRACYRHRWITLFTWLGGVACLITLWIQFGAAAQNTFNGSEPGQTVLNQHFPRASGDTLTLAIRSTAPVLSPAVKAQITSALVPFERAPHVTSVSDPYTTPDQLSRDGHIAFATVQFGVVSASIPNSEALSLMSDARAASGHGVTFSLGGDVVDLAETPYGGPTDGVGVAAPAVILLLASLTRPPALLGFSGTRLAKPSRIRPPRWLRRTTARSAGSERPAAERWAGVIQRHPVTAAVLSGAFILVLAAPALGMKLSMPDESSEQRGTMGYASYATMADGFGPGFDAPVIIAATLPNPHAGTAGLAAAVRATAGVAYVTPVVLSKDGEAAMMIAYPTTGEQNPATDVVVNRMHDAVLPRATAGTGIRAYVTGPNAGNVAFANLVGQKLPWLIGVVVALSMLLLLVVFRSVVIAVKAALMNLLSITAAYGVLVMVTQNGWLGGLFGFPEKMPVTTWVPMFLFVILFGLSMDYEVFLISRIREEYDRSGDNAAAVARGLSRTARVISAAAAIMVAVFLSIVIAPAVSTKQIGLGLAVAILIDATVVRLVLVPAVMELLGRANWWLPEPLARILPKTSLSEDEPPAEGPTAVPAGRQPPPPGPP